MNYNDVCNAPNHAGIYCFKNKVNGKCYVGQAIKLRTRLKQHWRTIQNNSIDNMIIYKAINKYGIDNFELSIVYEIRDSLAYSTKKRLDELEKEYIEKFDSYNNGYNSTLEGDAGVSDYKMTEAQIEKIKQNSLKQQELIREEKSKDFNNWVKSRNLQTKEEFVFKTIQDAHNALDISEYAINKCLNKTYHITKKCWQFCYYNEEFEQLPEYDSDDFKELSTGWFKELSNKEEICAYIKANPHCLYGDIKQQFTLSKKTFYNYKKELGITSEFRNDIQKEEFVNYMKDHNKEECMAHFGIKEKLFYTYRKKYLEL